MKLESTLRPSSGLLYAAPLVDVVLLLLVFFVLGSNFVVRSGMPVKVPTSSSILPPVEGSHVITVGPGYSPRIYVNEDEIALADLEEVLEGLNREKRHVILMGDQTSMFGAVMEISELVTEQGFDLAYATTQEGRR